MASIQIEQTGVHAEFKCIFVPRLSDDRHDVLRGDHARGAHELWGGSASHPSP